MLTLHSFLVRLEAAEFAVSDDEIETLARAQISMTDQAGALRGAYLKCLTAATKRALPAGPPVAPGELTDDAQEEQLETLRTIGVRYRERINAGFRAEGITDALERNQKMNYTRTDEAALRKYVEHGMDIRALHPPAVAKFALREGLDRLPPRPANRALRLLNTVRASLTRIDRNAALMSARDKRRTVSDLTKLVEKIQRELAPGASSTRGSDGEKAKPDDDEDARVA